MMKFKKKSVLLICFTIILLIIIKISFNANEKKLNKVTENRISRLESMRKSLIGKQLTKLSDVITKKDFQTNDSAKIILLYHTNDCTSCVEKALKVLSNVSLLYVDLPLFVISNEAENFNQMKESNKRLHFLQMKRDFFRNG